MKLLTDAGVLAGNPGVENGRIVSLVSQSPVGLIWVPFHHTKAEATLFTASQARWSFVWGPQSRVFFFGIYYGEQKSGQVHIFV